MSAEEAQLIGESQCTEGEEQEAAQARPEAIDPEQAVIHREFVLQVHRATMRIWTLMDICIFLVHTRGDKLHRFCNEMSGVGLMSAPDIPAPGLSTGAVARRLGVSATTVRSWERRYGLGFEREPGRHRRYTPQDVARLEYMCRLTSQGIAPAEAARQCAQLGLDFEALSELPSRVESAVPARAGGGNALPVGRAGAACHGLAKAAVRMDREAIGEVLDANLRRFGVVETWDALAAPVLRAVGRKWAGSNGRYVEVEHLLSCAISRCLHRMPAHSSMEAGRVRQSAGVVLLAGTPGELHTLPLEVLDAALAQQGVRALMLGAAVPAGALVSACTRTGSGAVVLWSQSRPTADTALLSAVSGVSWGPVGARTGTRVFAAGPGWQGIALPAQVNRLASLREAMALLGEPT